MVKEITMPAGPGPKGQLDAAAAKAEAAVPASTLDVEASIAHLDELDRQEAEVALEETEAAPEPAVTEPEPAAEVEAGTEEAPPEEVTWDQLEEGGLSPAEAQRQQQANQDAKAMRRSANEKYRASSELNADTRRIVDSLGAMSRQNPEGAAQLLAHMNGEEAPSAEGDELDGGSSREVRALSAQVSQLQNDVRQNNFQSAQREVAEMATSALNGGDELTGIPNDMRAEMHQRVVDRIFQEPGTTPQNVVDRVQEFAGEERGRMSRLKTSLIKGWKDQKRDVARTAPPSGPTTATSPPAHRRAAVVAQQTPPPSKHKLGTNEWWDEHHKNADQRWKEGQDTLD